MSEPNQGLSYRRVGVVLGLGLFVGCVLFLMLRGGVAIGAVIGVAGFLAAWLAARNASTQTIQHIPATGAPAREQRTDYFEVRIDEASGLMRGIVHKGLFADRLIEELRPAELALLWQDCRADDPASGILLEGHLDSAYPRWREDVRRGEAHLASGPGGQMSVAEAHKILGLAPGATRDQIRHAHRDLMLKLHPDRGGSTYLSSKINEAKDVLLAHDDQ